MTQPIHRDGRKSIYPPCDILHEPSGDSGWDTVPLSYLGRDAYTHVVPCGDLKRHVLDPDCWCDAHQSEELGSLWVHNAADGRETYEQGRPAN